MIYHVALQASVLAGAAAVAVLPSTEEQKAKLHELVATPSACSVIIAAGCKSICRRPKKARIGPQANVLRPPSRRNQPLLHPRERVVLRAAVFFLATEIVNQDEDDVRRIGQNRRCAEESEREEGRARCMPAHVFLLAFAVGSFPGRGALLVIYSIV